MSESCYDESNFFRTVQSIVDSHKKWEPKIEHYRVENIMEKINVEEIMEEIRAKIKDEGLSADVPPFEDVPIWGNDTDEASDLDLTVERLKAESKIEYYYEMPGGIRSIVKKVIRRSIYFVFFPILLSQNRFNSDVTQSLDMIHNNEKRNKKELLKRIEKLERENRILKRKIGK